MEGTDRGNDYDAHASDKLTDNCAVFSVGDGREVLRQDQIDFKLFLSTRPLFGIKRGAAPPHSGCNRGGIGGGDDDGSVIVICGDTFEQKNMISIFYGGEKGFGVCLTSSKIKS
ncbi:hypothetical protein L6452_13643 [Arctium lappa]|uniref:Uncharacterized protein n=1 Tax=Arctium lappa TaxID=4217 RepID=A0ACB9CIV3_ARCLA|nr:hypothetical protein L6452_13643 [Arctium lappa]